MEADRQMARFDKVIDDFCSETPVQNLTRLIQIFFNVGGRIAESARDLIISVVRPFSERARIAFTKEEEGWSDSRRIALIVPASKIGSPLCFARTRGTSAVNNNNNG